MPLTKIQFKPGINRETTSYANEGGWFDIDKVRFRFGMPEKIGGWVRHAATAFLGTCRALHPWVVLDSTRFLGIGTNLKYYLNQGGTFNDLTPIRLTTSSGAVTFAATSGSATITVTFSNHNAFQNDFVTFSGASSLGGNITSVILNQEYQIVSVLNTSSFTISARTVSTISSVTTTGGIVDIPVLANGSDTGNGGSSTVANFQLSVGLDTSVMGTGWGAGTWGRGSWDSNADVAVASTSLSIWSHDNFGEDLLINIRDGQIAYWDRSSGLGNRAILLKDLVGSVNAPTIAKQIMVSDKDRHIIAFGCDPQTDVGEQDPLLIRFSSQESLTAWNSVATNTAGDLRIGSGSEIITAVETRQQILVFTDKSLHAMQFLGPPFTFGINLISENISTASPLCAVAIEDSVYWMGTQEFYVYTGLVKRIPCTVRDYVFSDMNTSQMEKVVAGTNGAFAEIWWFYPSSESTENNKYVVYNYEQNVWYYGVLNRTAWIDRGIEDNPIGASTDNFLYNHESGFDDGSTAPASSIDSFVQSSQFDIGDGEDFVFLNKIIPDVTFRNSTAGNPKVTLNLKTRNFPGGKYLQNSPQAVTQSQAGSSSVVEQFTEQINIRLRGRSFALRVSSVDTGTTWRLGSPRINIRTDGKR